ncbi:MAG: serine/threonine protein kinase [Planctomycetaceae bacterium]|jgi:serine/threonine protein kinase|nr:serine/threonine protein kinase [Planctomycetaceae bacterium]
MIDSSDCPSDAMLDRFEESSAIELESDDLRAIERHIETCSSCQERLENRLDQHIQSLQLLLPEPIAGYCVLKLLGQGGQAKVYLARELSTQRQVALKLIPKPSSTSDLDLQAWRNEILVAARMDHLNLVRLYSVQENQHSFILVFEYIAGGTLQSQLTRHWTPTEIALIVSQIARGLCKIHSMGFLHLDLKPSNILLDRDGKDHPEDWVAKISDFGISLRAASLPQNHNNDSDSRKEILGLGTFEYMAPEQALGIQQILTPRTDLFALGRIFQQLLQTSADSLGKSALLAICDRCCQIDPNRRYASAEEFLDTLDRWIAGNQADGVVYLSRGIKWLAAFPLILLLALFGLNRRAPTTNINPVSEPVAISTESSISKDLSAWILQLDTPPEAMTSQSAKDIANTSAYWTSNCIDSGLLEQQPEQAIRYAVLQRAAAERIAGKVDMQHLRLARELLGNSSRLLGALRSMQPQDKTVLHELITTHYVSGLLRYHVDDIPKYYDYFENRLNSLQEVCLLLKHLADPVQQIYWSTRVLDELRVSRRTTRWGAQPNSLACVERIESTCGEILRAYRTDDSRLDVPDLTVRLMLIDSGKEVRKNDDLEVLKCLALDVQTQNRWFFPEDFAQLLRELIATELGRPIFELSQVNAKDFESLIDRLCEQVAAITGSDSMVPVYFQEDVFRFVASISTHHRLTDHLDQAQRIQGGYMEACDAFLKRFPDHPNLYLARSEGLLQAWKNALRKDDDVAALDALKKSYDASKRALELAPNNPLAHHQVSDRLKRITRFQSSQRTQGGAALYPGLSH